ncbi:MAG: hypothetical protein WAV48_06510 [Candidatus Magasanikiibacteriota bacterium]
MKSKPVGQRDNKNKKVVPRLVPVRGHGTLTFKPLHRGQFRCNQTGEKTNCPDRYANMHRRVTQVRVAPPPPPKPVELLKARKNIWGEVTCPHDSCRRLNTGVYSTGRHTCPYCHKVFEVI